MQQLANFDTHAAVKRLHGVGLANEVAEEIVSSMVLSRDYDLSKLVTKDQFFKFREENNERFNKIDTEIVLIKQEIKALRKDTKAEFANVDLKIEALRKDVIAEVAKGKSETIKWMVGLFIAQITAVVGLLITLLIKSHF